MTILCFGEIDLDIYLAIDRLPDLDHAATVLDEFENVGGAAANSALWLANWGMPTRLAGHDLGDDAAGDTVREILATQPQLDTRYIARHAAYPTPRCQCLVTPDGERSFITHWPSDLRITAAAPDMLADVDWLNLDMSGPAEPRLQAAKLARARGIPVLVNDIYRGDHPLLPLVDVLVISAAIARAKVKDVSPLQLARQLQARGGCDVVVTDGAGAVVVLPRGGDQGQIVPPAVSATDTTGAGDTFKAGLLYGLLQGLPLLEAARWGCAAASLMCQFPGTTRHLASLSEVEALLPDTV